MARARAVSLLGAALLSIGCSGRPAKSPGDAALPDGASLLPARVRRLTNLELERTISELVLRPESIARELPPDTRQQGYSVNAEQTVSAAWAARLHTLARAAAKRAAEERLAELAPCAVRSTDRERACVRDVVTRLGRRAYRRPLRAEEIASLSLVFDAGAGDGAGFRGGVEALLRALIESPALLYLSEIGEPGQRGGVVTLTPYEIASSLSYTVRGGPPDEVLLGAAESGALLSAGVREREARRLLGLSETRHHFRRFVLEWLEVQDLEHTTKSEKLFPDYEALKSKMLAETGAFVDEVMVSGGASVRSLLDAGFASVDPAMAVYYGLETWGERASLSGTPRAGVLQHASFLAAHAHEDVTSPVKRGDFVMRRLLCNEVRRPGELGIDLMIPPPSTELTTRERFSRHVSDPSCRGCHQTLDAIGYTFEAFDAAGKTRTSENGKPVDVSGTAQLGAGSVSWNGSLELSRWLAKSPDVASCFARQAFRYFSAQHDRRVERGFLALHAALPPELSGSVIEELVLYARSELFVKREVRP